MTVLKYKKHGSVALLCEASGSSCERVAITVEGLTGGTLSIGTVSAPLINGGCILDLSRLYDAEYVPTLRGIDEALVFEPLKKSADRISRSSYSALVTIELVKRLEENEKRLDDALKRLEKAEEMLGGIRLTK